jgi:cell division protein YceG involved in septum cleavage
MIEKNNSSRFLKKRMWLIGIAVLLVLLIISLCFFSKTVTAQRNNERTKLVTSVEIKRGDTLWSIASDYLSDEYSDLNEYIDEIKVSNGMDSDTIHVGNYIIIPYFADAGR